MQVVDKAATGEPQRTRSSYSKQMQSFLISPAVASSLTRIDILKGDFLRWANYIEAHSAEVFDDNGRSNTTRSTPTKSSPGGWCAPTCGCAGKSIRVIPYSIAVKWAEADDDGRQQIEENMPEVPFGYKTWPQALAWAARDVWGLIE